MYKKIPTFVLHNLCGFIILVIIEYVALYFGLDDGYHILKMYMYASLSVCFNLD